ncbi:hypothetical protein MES5069_930009 [Mesorhizobium escarrei]|uniref:DUF255 domain-containing protein n=1 Tax=Mesorhizobium escarrei TaxID=666018 RepID=A0ABM9EJU3_9HYPH|nr:hypothetical protein MES5069_930009 [Mesorhizobium escarrei]
MLTIDPGADVASYHNWQVVVLQPENWAVWTRKPEAELLRPHPAESLAVEAVRPRKLVT